MSRATQISHALVAPFAPGAVLMYTGLCHNLSALCCIMDAGNGVRVGQRRAVPAASDVQSEP